MTILSVNKTREKMGAVRPSFIWRTIMQYRTRHIAHAAIIAALYAVLTHMQNLLVPGSATWAIQLRLSEALCILAFFTPAAISGLTIGCLIFNLTFAGAFPTDFLVGSIATALAAWGMWRCRRITLGGVPLLGLLMPALSNALLVGWELSVCIGGGFWLNAAYVAAGEAIVLLGPGAALYYAMKLRKLDIRLFS